jgi:hypothetical protein
MKNIKTTLFGALPGLGVLVHGIASKNWIEAIAGAGQFLGFLFSKDHNSL